MALLLLSLMVILASVEGYNRPFTAFHRGQVEAVHGPRPNVGYRKIQPAYQRVQPAYQGVQPAYQVVQVVHQRVQPAYQRAQLSHAGHGHFQRKVPNFQPAFYQFGRNSAFSQFFSGNVVEQTRAQADSTKSVLRSLARNPRAAKYIERVIETSKCLNSVEDAIDGIEGAAKLVEKNGPEIIKLVETAESLENEKDVPKLVKAAANILRILDDLIPNLAAESSEQCNASPADTIKAFKELAGLVGDISNAQDLKLSYGTRQQLALSSKILSEVTSFLGKINKSLSSFDELCNTDKEFNINVINAIGDIMKSMAVLFDNLESGDRAKEIKSKGEFVKKAVEAFSDLDIDSTLECGTAGSLKALAQTLDDLSQIVDEIGIEKLSSELGIDLEFINDVQPASTGNLQKKVSNFQPALYQFGRISAFSQFFSGNVVEQTRAQADSTKAVLRSLARNPRAAKYIERVIETSKCLNSVEDAIDGIEGAAKLVEKNGPEIIKLVDTAESLENEKDVTKLVKAAANILRILDDLIPNLAAESSEQCNASPADTIEAFKELAGLVGDISNAQDLQLSFHTRQQLTLSSKILSEVTSFLGKINKSLSSFDELCNNDKNYNINVINAIGDIMKSMAVLFDNLGSSDRAKEIKSKGEFVKKAVEAFSDLDIDSSLECGTAGSLKALAQTLDDLSQIVDEIGIEKLSSELGLDLEFINSF